MADTIDNRAKAPKQQKTTGFTNINDIVKANRQNRLGQTVSGGVSNVVGQNQQQLGQAKSQFQEQSQANQFGGQADKEKVEDTLKDPTKASQDVVDRFAQFRSGQYQGPKQIANKDQLQAGQQDIQSLANASKDEYGRRGLLQRFVSPNQYTQGQQRLDNLLLGQTGGKALNEARRSANLYGRELTDAERSAEAQAKGLTEQASQFGKFVQGRLGEEETGLTSSVDQRVAQQRKEAEDARAALKALYSKESDTITQEQYDAAQRLLEKQGLAGHATFGSDALAGSAEEIVGQGIIDPTRLSVGTEEDKAKSLALAKLAGKQQGLYSQADQVGGYDPGSFLNRDSINKYLTQGREAYEKYDKDYSASKSRLDELANYDRDLRAMGQSNAESIGRQLQNLKQQQSTYLPDAPEYAKLKPQIDAIQTQYNQELAKQQAIGSNLRNRQMGLHLGEDEFAHGGGNYGMLMGQKMREATTALEKAKAERDKYQPVSFLDRLKGLIK